MFATIPEIMKTEVFWAITSGISALLLIGLLIKLEFRRHPELYKSQKKTTSKKST